MKTQIPWLRIVIEGVVIVGSILLAFGIDAWWEGRQEARLETAMATAVLEEIAANRIGIVEARRGAELRFDANDRFLRSTPLVLAQTPRDSVYRVLFAFGSAEDFEPISGSALAFLQTPAPDLAGVRARQLVNVWVQALGQADVERIVLQRRQESVQTVLARYATSNAEGGADNLAAMVARSGPQVLVELRDDDQALSDIIEKTLSHRNYGEELAGLMTLSDSVMEALGGLGGSQWERR